jgi:hypothetical protein
MNLPTESDMPRPCPANASVQTIDWYCIARRRGMPS